MDWIINLRTSLRYPCAWQIIFGLSATHGPFGYEHADESTIPALYIAAIIGLEIFLVLAVCAANLISNSLWALSNCDMKKSLAIELFANPTESVRVGICGLERAKPFSSVRPSSSGEAAKNIACSNKLLCAWILFRSILPPNCIRPVYQKMEEYRVGVGKVKTNVV